MTPITKLALSAALWLAAAPALADEWEPVDSGHEGVSAITFRGKDMLPGEEATFLYSGMQADMEFDDGGIWPTNARDVFFAIVVTSGSEPITGFEGVTLRGDLQGEDLVTFYNAAVTDSIFSMGLPSCGGYTLGDLPDGTEAQCMSMCFRNYDDLRAQHDVVACDGGEAHWIAILLSGRLSERAKIPPAEPGASEARKFMDVMQAVDEREAAENGWLTVEQMVAAANYLIVHVKWKGAAAALFLIDDTFRKAMWDMQ